MPRQTSLRPDFIETAADLYARGFTYDEVIKATGVPERTFYRWMEKGRAGKAPYRQLWQAIEAARISRWYRLIGVIEAAALKSWQAAAWLLERECPQRWASPEVKLKHLLSEQSVEIVDE